MGSVKASMLKAGRRFRALVWPFLQAHVPIFEFAKCYTVEGSDRPNSWLLDVAYGVDVIVAVVKGGKLTNIPLALRVQYDSGRAKPYNTFTIRTRTRGGKSTEMQKRMADYKAGRLHKRHLALQAYVEGRDVVAVGLVPMRLLYEYVDRHWNELVPKQKHNDDGSAFIPVGWESFRDEYTVNAREIGVETQRRACELVLIDWPGTYARVD